MSAFIALIRNEIMKGNGSSSLSFVRPGRDDMGCRMTAMPRHYGCQIHVALSPLPRGNLLTQTAGKRPYRQGTMLWLGKEAKNIRHLDYKGGRIPEEAPKANAK